MIGAPEHTMNAKEIMSRMNDAYLSCASYRDTGEVHVRGVPSGTFETEFVRSMNQFSFEFNGDDDFRCLVRADHGKLSEFRLPAAFPTKLRMPDGFGAAIATIAGITLGSAHVVPRLLMAGDLGGRSVGAVSQPAIVREETFAGETCAWIELGVEFPSTAVLVNVRDYTLRRVLVFSPRSGGASSLEQLLDLAEVPNHGIAYEPRMA
jgi:hypothetical protein